MTKKEGSNEKGKAHTLRYRILNLLRMGNGLFRSVEANNVLGAFKIGLKVAGLASIFFFVMYLFSLMLSIEIDIIRASIIWFLIFSLFILGGLPDYQRKQAQKDRGF